MVDFGFLVYAVDSRVRLMRFDGSLPAILSSLRSSAILQVSIATVSASSGGASFLAHLLNDFRPLRGKGFHLLGQAPAVIYDCLQRGNLWS